MSDETAIARGPKPKCGAKTRAGTPCQFAAGYKTDHVGFGKCRLHGGATPTRTGRWSAITHERLAPLVKAFMADPEPLDLLPEVALLRALVLDFVERYNARVDALEAWNRLRDPNARPQRIPELSDIAAIVSEVGKMVERIEKIRVGSHLSEHPEFRRIMGAVGAVVQAEVGTLPGGRDVLVRIHQGLQAIPR